MSKSQFAYNSNVSTFKFKTIDTSTGTLTIQVKYLLDPSEILGSHIALEAVPTRTFNSSPFPSPKMAKKMLGFVQAQMNQESRLKSKMSNEILDSDPAISCKPPRSTLNSMLKSPYPLKIDTLNKRRSSIQSPTDLFGSLVGSYEESILSGRMSTFPSKPMAFFATIGAVASGNLKPAFPPHLTIPFLASYYELEGNSTTNPSSPYVGAIDLDSNTDSTTPDSNRSSNSLATGYRIPSAGKLQIVSLG